MTKCLWHLCNNETKTYSKGKFCSLQCKNKYYVTSKRKKLKEKAIEYKGGKCGICGYNKCVAALQFHHIDGNKDFGIADKGYTRAWETVKQELDKCILVCANCHAEIHNGNGAS